jgi:hypothetical protein
MLAFRMIISYFIVVRFSAFPVRMVDGLGYGDFKAP